MQAPPPVELRPQPFAHPSSLFKSKLVNEQVMCKQYSPLAREEQDAVMVLMEEVHDAARFVDSSEDLVENSCNVS